ncbi:MAG: hypothetical protein V4610_25280 [Pseudomonadota bacterium]
MALQMVGVAGMIYAPRGGNEYTADADGVITPDVEDTDVRDMVAAGCMSFDVWVNTEAYSNI